MTRAFYYSGCFAFALLAVSVYGAPVSAAIVKGPYLENVGPDRITVSWESDRTTDGRLRYGLGDLSQEVAVLEGTGRQSITLTGLQAGKTYFYRLELYDGAFSPTLTFSTAPAGPEPFHFLVVGDTRTDHPMHREVVGLIGDRAPDFYVNTGDIVEDGDDSDMWQIFFDIEHAPMSQMVMWPVMGNHDHRTNTLYDTFFQVDSDSGTSRYYSFDYSNCHFVVLCSDEDFSPTSAQYQWIDNDLSAARSNPAVEHIFVFYHRPPFSSGWHGSEDMLMAEYLHPLVMKHGVEIVFNGHDHDYERSTVDGIFYIVTGGGGAPYPPLFEEDQPPLPDQNPHRQVFFGVFHVVDCAVAGEEVRCEMIDLTRTVRDTFGVNLVENPENQQPQCEPCESGCTSAGRAGSLLMFFILAGAIWWRRKTYGVGGSHISFS
ncbi:MAG: metallophosphoesterase family protein [Deltaproteobacteria bacterium]|nr:metallophosphoesterase family protein [Deltaproteobacteria bacterium]